MKPLYNRKKARTSLVHTAFFRALSQLATMVSYIVLVRAMPEHDFGVYNLLYAVIPVVSTIASFGLEQTLRRFQPEYLQAGNTAAAARLVRMVATGRLASSFLVLGTILLAWNSVAHFFGLGPYRGEFALFCLVVLLYFQTNILQMTLASHMLHRFSVGMLSVLAVAKLIAYLLISWFGALTLERAILADTAAYVITYIGLRYAHYRYCRVPAEQHAFRFNATERRRLLRYGFFNNLNDAGSMALNVRTDNFFIAALMNPYAVGAYAFYVRLALMAARLLPTKMFENVVQPLFFSIPSQQAEQRVPRYFTALLNTSLLTQLPLAAYAFAYHREIVEVLFAGKFVEYSWLLPVVFAFSTINVLGIPVTLVAQHAERTSILLTSKILAIWNVLGLLLLVPVLGIFGAALASGSAEAMKNLFVWWHVRDRARWTNGVSMMLSTIVVWGSVVAICLLLKSAFDAKPIVHLMVGGLITTLGALVFVRSPALSKTDREVLASVLHGREARALRWLGLLPAR